MEREARVVVDLKQKLIEFSKIKAELVKEIGEEIPSDFFPPAEFEEEDFDLEVQGDEVYWSCTDKSTWLITYGATPISYFDKTNKEIKLIYNSERNKPKYEYDIRYLGKNCIMMDGQKLEYLTRRECIDAAIKEAINYL